ncbi:MAG: Lar family restriction alleviation protein [Synergistaceae bacterium]|nr:Lar family restriction alleviation protein [Synergistaceae bacterium]MBR1604083.1 Lar family restriction alleviation protein [Synergistaceae bacterium]
MNESEVKLKHCPFCGGEALIGTYWGQEYYAQCQDCFSASDDFNTPQDAADAWNRRVGE